MKPGNLLKISRSQKLLISKYKDGSNNEGDFKNKQYQKIRGGGVEINIESVFKTLTLSMLSTT